MSVVLNGGCVAHACLYKCDMCVYVLCVCVNCTQSA